MARSDSVLQALAGRPIIPVMGRLASLRFAFDPPGFLRKGRELGRLALGITYRETESGMWATGPSNLVSHNPIPIGHWCFWLVNQKIIVVSDPDDANEVLSSKNLRLFRSKYLVPFLGASSSYLRDDPSRNGPYRWAAINADFADSCQHEIRKAASKAFAVSIGKRLPQEPPSLCDLPVDVVDMLRSAALMIAIRQVLGVDSEELAAKIYSRLLPFLHAADTPALVAPIIRGISPRFLGLKKADTNLRAVLLEAEIPKDQHDATITHMVGWADQPVMVAAKTLALFRRWEEVWEPKQAVEWVLSRHPTVPLALREAMRDTVLCGIPLQKGDAIAVDLQAAQLPTGAGSFSCPMVKAGRLFAATAVETLLKLGFRVDGSKLKEGRTRLSYGPTSLPARYPRL